MNILKDIKFSVSSQEKIASAAFLYEPLVQFYLRAERKWRASGKLLLRYFEHGNSGIAAGYILASE